MTGVKIHVAAKFAGWRLATLQALAEQYDASSKAFPSTVFADVLSEVSKDQTATGWGEKELKKIVMPFAKYKMEKAGKGGMGLSALGEMLSFNEKGLFAELVDYIKEAVGLQEIHIVEYDGDQPDVYPGEPLIEFL